MWIKDPKLHEAEVFVQGTVISSDGKKVTVSSPAVGDSKNPVQVWDEGLVFEVRRPVKRGGGGSQCMHAGRAVA